MSAFDFLICGGLTAVGLVLSWVRYRRKGPRPASGWPRSRCCRWPPT